MDSAAVERFGAIYAALEAELDWELLGRLACEGDGGEFFDAALRARCLDSGLRFADALAARLDPDAERRSCYVGAAVAELAPILCEQLILGREVHWSSLAGQECDELRRAVGTIGARFSQELALPHPGALDALAAESCDHLWLVSVLTDPEAFPALHDELYARQGTELATGRGHLDADLARAKDLGRSLLIRAAARCTLTSTDEELTLLGPLAESMGLRVTISDRARVSALVGDPVRHCGLARD